MKYSPLDEVRFRSTVYRSLQQMQKVLDTTRNPCLAEDEEHKYDDKFALAEFLTETALASQMNVLEHLGLDDEKLQIVKKWVHDEKKSVTLRFQAHEECTLLKEEEVEISSPETIETMKKTTNNQKSLEETKTFKVVYRMKQYHWKITFSYKMYLFPANDFDQSLQLQSRTTSTTVIKSGGKVSQYSNTSTPPSPFPKHLDYPVYDVSLNWFMNQIDPKATTATFGIDRKFNQGGDSNTSCKTPRRNKNIDEAVSFNIALSSWAKAISQLIPVEITGFVKSHTPAVDAPSGTIATPGTLAESLNSLSDEGVLCPIVPLMENCSVLSASDAGSFLSEQSRSLGWMISEKLAKEFPAPEEGKLVSITEAKIVLLCQHMHHLALQYIDSVDYIEHMLQKQLIQAIGKEVTSADFEDFMRFHNRKFYAKQYARIPFSHVVRRPMEFPDGVVTIETENRKGQDRELIETWVRRLPGSSSVPVSCPINASTSIELQGDRVLHGWMRHCFDSGTNNAADCQLCARARQFSSFMLLVGSMAGPDHFEAKNAIILQNKDEVMIPLLMDVLPTAKQFKDAIASLSPEQQSFAKAFREMQLSSSLFAVCVIQLKPQLEKVLGLPDGSLTKEIQLTQDLMSLFIDHQIPSNLLSLDIHDRSEDRTSLEKVEAVRGYVKSVMDVIDVAKQAQLEEAKRVAQFKEAERRSKLESSTSLEFSLTSMPMGTRSARPMTISRCMARPAAVDQLKQMARPMRMKKKKMRGDAVDQLQQDTNISDQNQLVSFDNNDVLIEGGKKACEEDRVSSAEDFTLIPKLLDATFEKFDTDNSLHATVVKSQSPWLLKRQENLLTTPTSRSMSTSDADTEKKKAFDLLDAITRSGTLPIACSELHVIVAVSHCFENDLMGSVIEDNINPIEKVEKSSLMIASRIHGVSVENLVKDNTDLQRLKGSFPELLDLTPF